MEQLINLRSQLSICHPKRNEYDPNKAQRILDILDTLSSSTDGDTPLPPPLDVLVYAIQNILYPQPLYAQISDLLRLLTMVEFWRLRAMSIISSALVFQNYYKEMEDPFLVLLPVKAEDEFRNYEESSEKWRGDFIQIISGCTKIHMERLWLSRSNTEFWAQWNEYFSYLENVSISTAGDEESSEFAHPFHHRLSTKDIDALLRPLESWMEFIDESLRTAENQQRTSGESFDQIFKPEDVPTFNNDFLSTIDIYLECVPKLVRDVHNVFPVEFPLP